MNIFESLGLKRRIAAMLSIVIELAATVPELAPLLPILQYIAGLFGVTGVVHGAVSQTVSKHVLATLASLFTTLATLGVLIPALAPFEVYFRKAAAILGGIVLGVNLPSKLKDNA